MDNLINVNKLYIECVVLYTCVTPVSSAGEEQTVLNVELVFVPGRAKLSHH